MTQSIVEISQDGRHLSLFRGFLKISEGKEEIASIPLDNIYALLLNCYQATVTQNILLTCVNEGIPVILCNSNHHPAGILWPVVSHYKQAGNLQVQLSSSKPLAKQLWKQLIQCKIMGQHLVLNITGCTPNGLEKMAERVKSGDIDNLEAQAARRYWPLLMGKDFIRNPDLEGINSLLNYGYAVLRATVARAVISVGLHPSLGVHHRNRLNAFCLVDDLMEPYRPVIDFHVYHLLKNDKKNINPETKKILSELMQWNIIMPSEITTLSMAVLSTAQSLARSFIERKARLLLPLSLLPENTKYEKCA